MLFIRWFILAFVILGIAHTIPGIYVSSFGAALLFALVLGVINAFIRPLLLILSLPITLLTVGLFALVINALTFWLAGSISAGVHVEGFWGAFWGGLIVWAAS